MINRILIRIKVVQILYSYLLTRSEFRIKEPPTSISIDRRYGYQAYLELLLLLVELSGYSTRGGLRKAAINVDYKLSANRVGKALSQNDEIRALILRAADSDVDNFGDILQTLHDKIVASSVYQDYKRKRSTDLADDVQLWVVIFETIISKDSAVESALRKDENYTHQGMLMAYADVVDTLKSYADSRLTLIKAKKDLTASLDKAYELYLTLFKLIIDITDAANTRIQNAKTKLLVTSEDLNPNTRFVDNALVGYLKEHEQLANLIKEYKVESTTPTSTLIKNLLDKIQQSDLYEAYINQPVSDFAGDVSFWIKVMRTIILPSSQLAEDLEDRSVYWNDDLEIMGTFVLKTLRRIERSEGATIEMLPKYKDLEDERFGPELFMYSIDNYDTYRKYIDMFVNGSSWDPERLAYMDIVIMITAIAEIINYPAIPVPVTVNEYVEMANNYSSDKSGAFINGILFSIIQYLNQQGIIKK